MQICMKWSTVGMEINKHLKKDSQDLKGGPVKDKY